MPLQFSNTISSTNQSLREHKSSDSFQSFAGRKQTLANYKRDIGNVPTLYNIDTHEPLPICHADKEWSISSTASYSPVDPAGTPYYRNLPLWWTSLVAVVPILAFTIAFVAIVFAKRAIIDYNGPFDDHVGTGNKTSDILVEISATRLVFIAGFSSTLAPMLLGSLMTLWHYPTAMKMVALSNLQDPSKLPTPQQLSILIGLCAGSLDDLRKYVYYHFRRFRAAEATILTKSALVLLVSAMLAGLVLAGDIAVHNYTSTIAVSISAIQDSPSSSYGRGLAEHCLGFDRIKNQGLPCTVVADASVGANAVAFDSSEIIAMQSNQSKVNSMWQVPDHDNPDQDLVLLMPQTEFLDAERDFIASTIGVGTHCTPSTQRCDVRLNDDANNTYVLFNCTENFRGALGAPESFSAVSTSWTRTDATTPDFNFKLDRNFQYAYFSDAGLTTPYNSIGGIPGSGNDSSATLALPDSSLLRTYHLAVAGIIPVQSNSADSTMLSDPSALALSPSLIAYTLNCSVSAYSINYTWSTSNILSYTSTLSPNGSILELAHGMQAVGMPSLSQAQSLASLTPNMTLFARAYANLHSQDTIALISSATSPRRNTHEALRHPLLVAKLPLWAFICSVAANAIFILFACVLAARALLQHARDPTGTRDMVAKLSVEGLAASAFEDRNGKQNPGEVVVDPDDMFEESRIGVASRRVALRKAVGGAMALRIEQPHL
jgi:hypothetical protein